MKWFVLVTSPAPSSEADWFCSIFTCYKLLGNCGSRQKTSSLLAHRSSVWQQWRGLGGAPPFKDADPAFGSVKKAWLKSAQAPSSCNLDLHAAGSPLNIQKILTPAKQSLLVRGLTRHSCGDDQSPCCFGLEVRESTLTRVMKQPLSFLSYLKFVIMCAVTKNTHCGAATVFSSTGSPQAWRGIVGHSQCLFHNPGYFHPMFKQSFNSSEWRKEMKAREFA